MALAVKVAGAAVSVIALLGFGAGAACADPIIPAQAATQPQGWLFYNNSSQDLEFVGATSSDGGSLAIAPAKGSIVSNTGMAGFTQNATPNASHVTLQFKELTAQPSKAGTVSYVLYFDGQKTFSATGTQTATDVQEVIDNNGHQLYVTQL